MSSGAMPGPPQALRCVCAWAALLACDLALWAGLERGSSLLLPAPRGPFAPERLARLWLLAGLRLAALWRLAGGARRRGLAALCLLGPAYESGRLALGGRPLGAWGPGFAALRLGATAAAALFWEGSFPEGGAPGGVDSVEKQKAWVLLMRVIHYSKPDALLLGGAFFFLTLAVLCSVFIPFYTGKVIDILGSQYQESSFLTAILFMGLFSIGSSISAGLRGGLFTCTESSLNRRLRILLFKSLIRQEVGFFDTTKTGDITSRLSSDTSLVSDSITLNVNLLLRSLVKMLGVLCLMTSLSWKLTLVALIDTPLIALIQKVYNSYYERLSKEVQDSVARANEAAGESVSGIRTLRSFNTEESEARRYDSRLEDTHLLKTRRDTVRAVYLLLRRLVTLGVQVLMLYYGHKLISEGQLTTGTLVSFLLYQEDVGNSLMTVVEIFGDMLNSVGAAGKVFEYLDRRPQVCAEGSLQPPSLRGHVQFRNVTFCYPSRPDRPALQGLSMELRPGQITALVGPSGGGKTTCVSLLERFYGPQEGEILLDGHLLQEYEHSYLHSKVSMVGQEPVLFSGSIQDNIAYGLPDCPLERVQRAAESANAHNFISALEQGYNTDVGERGAQLSGGEKQRIAIARALIRDPQILILDEATSSLDADSEHAIQQALSGCSRTVLVVAHRLKTVERADQIILIDGGRVLEQGTHQELMASRGSYYRLRERLFTEENGDQ